MANKEERIFVFTTIKYTIKETNEDGVIVDGFIEPRDKAKMYTRQEAIEVMAPAIMSEFFLSTEGSIAVAETALNALLEGVKK